jgi:signal transduction histidine kinase
MAISTAATRAKRFPWRFPLQYRASGTSEWRAGEIENISCSGVLFRGPQSLPQTVPVEMMVQLPPGIGGSGLSILGGGYVARTIEPASAGAGAGLAVALVEVRLMFAPAARAPLRQSEGSAPSRTGAALGHRVRNLLFVIMGNCDVLLHETKPEDNLRKSLLRIKEAAGQTASLVREI